MESMSKGESKVIRYFVNGEAFETSEHKLTVRTILEEAGCTPADDYRLQRDNGLKVFEDPSEEIPVHKDESFTAIYKGPTQTS